MKVHELIAALQKMDPEALVVIQSAAGVGIDEVGTVEMSPIVPMLELEHQRWHPPYARADEYMPGTRAASDAGAVGEPFLAVGLYV